MEAVLCSPSGLNATLDLVGKEFFDTSISGHVNRVHLLYKQIYNSSKLILKQSIDQCWNSMKRGESNVLISRIRISESGNFHKIPYAIGASKMSIISGYDYTEYSEKVKKGKISSLGILGNFKSIEFSVYPCIAVLLIMLLVLALVYLAVYIEKRNLLNRRTTMAISLRYVRKLLKNTYEIDSKKRMWTFLAITATFLIFTPFLTTFTTDQVVVPKPLLIRSFDEAISQRAAIFVSKSFMKPELFLNDPVLEEYLAKNKEHLEWFSQIIKDTINKQFDRIMNKKAALVLPDYIAQLAIKYLCAFNSKKDGHFDQFSSSASDGTKEILTGTAIHTNFTNHKAMKTHLRVFEMGLTTVRDDGDDALTHPSEISAEYMRICANIDHLEKVEQQQIYGNLKLFDSLIIVCVIMLVLASICLIVEVLLPQPRPRRFERPPRRRMHYPFAQY